MREDDIMITMTFSKLIA